MVNYIIGGFILLAVILAIRKIRKDRKNGSCCGGCSGCSSSGQCSPFDALEEEIRAKQKEQ